MQVFRIVQDDLWNIEDLKGISVRGGDFKLWKYTVEKGIPDGLAVTLATALKQVIKQLYREQNDRRRSREEDAVACLQALQYM